MTRTVRDAALLLAAMAGVDARDAATTASAGKVPADLHAVLDPNALKGARIGVLRGPFAGYSPASDEVLDAAVTKLKSLGADGRSIPSISPEPASTTTARSRS